MLIFIEGTDRTGKSTLAKMLANYLVCLYEHCSKPRTNDPYREYENMLKKAKGFISLVYDRGYLGEYVYSRLWRGGCKITDEQFKSLDRLAIQQNAILIHAFAPDEVILERCKQVGEELLKPEQIQKCSSLFEEIASKTLLPVYKYDSSKYTPEQFFEQIKPVIDKIRESEREGPRL